MPASPISCSRWATAPAGTVRRGRARFAHPGGIFPRIALVPGETNQNGAARLAVPEVAIKVERVADFSRAHDLGLEMVGYPVGPYRVGRVPGDGRAGRGRAARLSRFRAISGRAGARRAMKPHAARDALAARDLWQARRRRFDDDEEGIAATEACLERVIELAGSTDLACHLVFEVERDYWQSRNTAAQAQKARQDRLGLGGPTTTIIPSAARGGSFPA